MVGLRDSVTESRVLQGRDARSIRVLIPDCRDLDQNFHDVTVSMPELSELAHKWPPASGTTTGVRGYAQGGESAIQKETAGADHVNFVAP